MNAEARINSLMDSFHRSNERQKAELQKLCQSPTNYDIALALTDAMLNNLAYLFNFKHAVSGNGKRCEILDLHDRLEADVKATFKRLTGREYSPPICRSRRAAR